MSGSKTTKNTNLSADEYMNDEQLQYFIGILENWKQEIFNENARTRKNLRDVPAQTADLNDRATQEEEFSLELRARDRELKLLNKINKALTRISQNEFGWCENCGEEIGIKRLQARPTAELCIDCKSLSERKEKSYQDVR